MRATIKDVAEKVGVTPASVSLVLNHKECRITEETKQKIFDAAKELNYITKKEKVQNNRESDGYVIGFIYPILHNELTEECILGVENYASIYGYHVVQMYCSNSSQRCIEQIALATSLGLDGLIVFPPFDTDMNGNNIKLGEALKNSGIPYLLLDKAVYQVFCDFVTADYKLCSGMATNHLIEKGHKKIGIILGKEDMFNATKHLEGYKEELILHGMSCDDALIYYGSSVSDTGYEGVEYLMSKGVTAIVSCDKNIALGIYDYARKNNVIFGEDLSIISIGGVKEAECIIPSLTCIQQPGKQMGIKAIEVIINRITKVDTGNIKTHYFTPSLIEGESVKKINM